VNGRSDLEEFIAPSQILKELGGDEDWEYKFVEPVAGENDKLKDTETRDKLIASREEIVKEFEAETLKWIQNPEGDEAAKTKAKRDEIASRLKADYWKLDPYVRARSIYDRTGAILDGGKIDWYSGSKADAAPANGAAAAPETNADDVD
jgi:hypothetical protein